MKVALGVIGFFICTGIFVCFLTPSPSIANQDKAPVGNLQHESKQYNDLRNLAFGVTPKQLGLRLPSGRTNVYGVVMDWNMGSRVATLVAFQTGDGSLYIWPSGGIVGGIAHENVRKSVISFIGKAQSFLDKAKRGESGSPPGKDFVKFYLLTNKGKFVFQEHMKNFENHTSKWTDLFDSANKVITQLRKVAGM